MIDFNTKIAPCPRCCGTAYLDGYRVDCDRHVDMNIVCDHCGLQLDYYHSPFSAPEVRWTYKLQDDRDVLDVWEKGGLDEFKPDE